MQTIFCKSSGRNSEGDFLRSDWRQNFIIAEQFEQLKHGVTKIRISMVPFCHDRSFDKGLIGKPLYDLYKKLKDVDF